MLRHVVLDPETTGLDAVNGDRIVEIGCVEIINRRVTNNHYHVYINPEREVPDDAVKIHGLTTDFLSDKPKFVEIAEGFQQFIKDSELIIHNATFDVCFLDAEFDRISWPHIDTTVNNVIDSLMMAKRMFPGKRNNLDILCDRFGIDNTQRTLHGALLDAELLAEVYLAMTRGQKSLMIDSVAASSSTPKIASHKSDLLANSVVLTVLKATKEELKIHEKVMDDIEKENKGKQCIWRNTENSQSVETA